MEKLTTRMQIRYLYYVIQFVDRYLENLQDWSDQSNSYGPPFPPPPHPREKKKSYQISEAYDEHWGSTILPERR